MEGTVSLVTTMDTMKKNLTQETEAEVLSIRLTSLKMVLKREKCRAT
jgi:hypothetical protein